MTETLRNLRIFVAAYEERSFTTAAEREHATQSGSRNISAKLEERFGVALFKRENARVSPTPAADAYYLKCVQILRLNADAITEVTRFGKGLDGEVTIGLMPTMTRCALAPALDRFTAQHPNVNVRVFEGYSAMLVQQVKAGDLDFAIVPASRSMVGLRRRSFLTVAEILVTRAGASDQDQTTVRMSEMGPLKVLLPSASNARNQTLKDYFAANNIQIERIMELDSMMGTLDYVARTDWVTILPKVMVARDLSPRLLARQMMDPGLSLDLVLTEPERRPMSPAADAICALLREETEALSVL